MKVLGLIASYRKLGNTEVLVKEAALAASAGAEIELLRLTDLKVEPCKGCMACVFKPESKCLIDDDMEEFLDKMRLADGLILGAPTYVLAPPGILKLLLDRFLMLYGRYDDFRGKKAVAIGVAGLPGWAPFTVPFLNYFLLAFGYDAVGSMMAFSPGPGEVLLDEKSVREASSLGAKLLAAMESRPVEKKAGPNICPVCEAEFFAIRGNRAECPICNVGGSLVPEGDGFSIVFDPQGLQHHRWTVEEMKRHFTDWILQTGKRYMELRPEIEARKARYRRLRYDQGAQAVHAGPNRFRGHHGPDRRGGQG